jgi:putative glutathione S-transferase
MGLLIDGQWHQEDYRRDAQGGFVRDDTLFHGQVRSEGPFLPEAGRYHLYVGLACPWAHRTLIMRALRGLEEAIPFTAVDPWMGPDGWFFSENEPDLVLGARFLRDVYTAAVPGYTGRVTVPLLWDRRTGTIVNNESRQIMRMLDHDFAPLATREGDYCPPDLRDQVEETLDAIYQPINNGVYRAGFAFTQEAHEAAVGALFAALEHWEGVLAGQRFLCGDRLTEADIALFTTLFRFDPVYHVHFKCNRKRLVDMPDLCRFAREIYGMPGVAETCRLDHIKQHYYRSHPFLNPRGLVPVGPDRDFRDC